MVMRPRVLAAFSFLALATANHNASIDTSVPYWLVTPPGSRSPDEYLEWSDSYYHCMRDDDYNIGRCVPTHLLTDSPDYAQVGRPPATALWWFIPVHPEDPGALPNMFHIVAGIDSYKPAMMLNFENAIIGDPPMYPKPYYHGAEEHAEVMRGARFTLQVASHDVATNGGAEGQEDLYYIITGKIVARSTRTPPVPLLRRL